MNSRKKNTDGAIKVGCAIIRHGGQLLIAQRKPGDHLGGYWEFPGGKIKPGETLEDCLVREVREELGVVVRPFRLLCVEDHVYPSKTVRLYFYFCDWISGRPVPHDCLGARWVRPGELRSFRFPPADSGILSELIGKSRLYFGPSGAGG